ncbi:LysR family transcriptional regulator [Streptomyces sp. NPDC020362]|uniref:LysR family transcriptional regulator n=1 Tax=unclassified Streptomyces TaxID=2593676 RepID=UPI000AD752E0
MTLNLQQLMIFTQVIESGGFSAAAERLFMSQSTVSKQVRKLETSVRATLVDRSSQTARPTPAGEVLLAQAREILAMADQAVSAVQGASQPLLSRLVVGATPSLAAYMMPPLILHIRQRLPAANCTLVVGTAAELADRLAEGSVAIAVCGGVMPAGPHIMEDLTADALALVGPPDHPLAGRTVEPAELSSQTFLIREPGSGTRQHTDEMMRHWGLTSAARIEMWGVDTIKQAVQAGLGISLLSRCAVSQELREGRLSLLDIRPGPHPQRVVVAYGRSRSLSAAEHFMLMLLRSTFGPRPPLLRHP